VRHAYKYLDMHNNAYRNLFGGMRMSRKIWGIFLSVLIIFSLVGCQKKGPASVDKIKQSGVLVVATSADYPPFESIDEKDGKTVIGFDADIADAIAKKLGVKVEYKNMDFKGLLAALVEGKANIIIAGYSSDEERRKSVDFSDVYFVDKQLLIIKGDNTSIKTAADMKGKKIGAQLGTTCEKAAQSIQGINYKAMDKVDQLMLEVKNGRLDGVVVNLTVAMEYIKSLGGLTAVDIPELNTNPTGYSVAVQKGDTELVNIINGVIKEMKSNGEYDKLLTKWNLSTK
jgi:polar amino acid transport system substrate-binding protein